MADGIDPLARRPRWASIRRIPQLWGVAARLEWALTTRSTRTALSWALSDLVFHVGSVASLLVLASRFSGVGRWTHDQILFLLAFVSLSQALFGAMFSMNVGFISRIIGRGQLDHRLLQPIPLWMALFTEGFSPLWAGVQLVPGVVLAALSFPQLRVALDVVWWLRLAASLLCSVLVQLSFQFIWGSTAFWAPRSAEEISSSTMRFVDNLRPFPLDGFGGGFKGLLVTVLPTGLMGWYPARGLVGAGRSPLVVLALATTAFMIIAASVFRAGLARMFGVGIGRYSDFGHRQ